MKSSLKIMLLVYQDAVFLGDSSLLSLSVRELFSLMQRNVNRSEYLVSVSMLQVRFLRICKVCLFGIP